MSNKVISVNSLSDFELSSVSFLEPSGIQIVAEVPVIRDGKAAVDDFNYTKRAVPHDELETVRAQLVEHLAAAYGITQGYDKALIYAPASKHETIKNARAKALAGITVTKVTLAGKDHLQGVIISGKTDSFYESKSAMNTPRIVFSSDKIGIESKVEILWEALHREVYEFIFNDKRKEQNLFNQPAGAEDSNND